MDVFEGQLIFKPVLPAKGYADALLDLIKIPSEMTISEIVLMYNTKEERCNAAMEVRFQPFTTDHLGITSRDNVSLNPWWGTDDVIVVFEPAFADSLLRAIKARWPEARVFDVQGYPYDITGRSLLEHQC